MRMQWIDWGKPDLSPKRVSLSLGGFDGIHLGHQFLIKKLVQRATEKQSLSALCVFEPLPFQVLRNIKPFKRLFTLFEMEGLLSKFNLDFFCILPFNKELSKISPEDFIESFLIPHFEPLHILTGYDFSFARNREGDFSFLKSYQKKHGFSLERASVFEQKGRAVSSSLIREHLKSGDLKTVKELLGRPFSIEGKVLKGKGRGGKLGFPTANLNLEHKELPCFGVYKASAAIKNPPGAQKSPPLKAVVNIGRRPTFYKDSKILAEAHILGFNQDIYGQILKLDLEDFLRKERKFQNAAELKEQIKKDIKKH